MGDLEGQINGEGVRYEKNYPVTQGVLVNRTADFVVDIPEGSLFKIKAESSAISSLGWYISNDGGTTWTRDDHIILNKWYERSAPSNINRIAIYVSASGAISNGNIKLLVEYSVITNGLKKRVEDIEGNKASTLDSPNNTTYPTTKAVVDYVVTHGGGSADTTKIEEQISEILYRSGLRKDVDLSTLEHSVDTTTRQGFKIYEQGIKQISFTLIPDTTNLAIRAYKNGVIVSDSGWKTLKFTFDITTDYDSIEFYFSDRYNAKPITKDLAIASVISLYCDYNTIGLESSTNSISSVSPKLTYIAHRGVHCNAIAPHNSVDAVYLAARAGFDYTEMDLRKTSDGVYVVMHATFDGNVRTKDGYQIPPSGMNVENITFAELENNWVLQSPNVEMRKRVPTFAEMLTACKISGIKPYIHDKRTNSLGDSEFEAIWNIIMTYYGDDDFMWASTYKNLFREKSNRVNLCVQMEDYIPNTNENTIIGYVNAYKDSAFGEGVHTNNGAYNDNPEDSFNIETISKWTRHKVKYGVYETGRNYQPDMNKVVKNGVNMIVTDWHCPPQNGRPSYKFAVSDSGNYDDFETNGTINNGELVLTEGQSIAVTEIPTIYFGGCYISIQLIGSASLNIRGYIGGWSGESNITLNGTNENDIFHYQFLVHDFSPTMVLTAKAGGCRIKAISYNLIKY